MAPVPLRDPEVDSRVILKPCARHGRVDRLGDWRVPDVVGPDAEVRLQGDRSGGGLAGVARLRGQVDDPNVDVLVLVQEIGDAELVTLGGAITADTG